MTEAVSGGMAMDAASILDTPQQFTGATSYQVRDALQELLERDLLGPWDGADEVLPLRSQGPGERYLVGRLGPYQSAGTSAAAAGEAATVDAENAAGGDGADPELPDLLTMQNAGRMWASSIGLSCVADPDTDILTVTATWGQYVKAEVLRPSAATASAIAASSTSCGLDTWRVTGLGVRKIGSSGPAS